MQHPNEECMGKGVGQYVVHILTSAAALVESKCFFSPPVFTADFCAITIVGGSTETGLMAVAERLLLSKVVWRPFLGALHQDNGSGRRRVMTACDS